MVGKLPSRFPLGWSHYVELLTIDSPDERRFYEIKAAANQWSVRELERQSASSLYQRLALSRDKDEIRRLSREGQIVTKAADLIKNPLVLEFLGLDERPHYTEEELESAIIDKLETFLLARDPELRRKTLGEGDPAPSHGKCQVVGFNGRSTDAPGGIWGAIAEPLGKADQFARYCSPLLAIAPSAGP